MYLLEETPKAKSQRRKIINLLQSGNKANFYLGCQRIEEGGFHQDFLEILNNSSELHLFKMEELENLYDFLLPFIKDIHTSSYQKGTLPNKIFLCKNLRSFIATCPFLKELPKEIEAWKDMAFFSLRNKITCLPEEVGHWKNLTYLNLANNQLTALPASAKNWVNLKTIDISGNPIPNLPTQLQKRYEIQNDWQELLAQINGTQ